MRRITFVLLLLCAAWLPAPAATQIHSAEDEAGSACGPGDREGLRVDAADIGLKTKVLDGTGDTWNVAYSTCVPAGTWTASFAVDVGTGGGAPPKVTALIARYNSSCVIQDTIVSAVVGVSKGDSDVTYTTSNDPGQIEFTTGDFLLYTLTKTSGSVSITVRYENAEPTHILRPSEACPAAGGRRVRVVE